MEHKRISPFSCELANLVYHQHTTAKRQGNVAKWRTPTETSGERMPTPEQIFVAKFHTLARLVRTRTIRTRTMPTFLKVPDYSQKSVQRRQIRKQRILNLIENVEPPHIAHNLRSIRILLSKRLKSAIKGGESDEVHTLTADFCKVSELLLRLAKVPQAPPGKLAVGRLSAPIELEPESEPVTVADAIASAAGEQEDEPEPFAKS